MIDSEYRMMRTDSYIQGRVNINVRNKVTITDRYSAATDELLCRVETNVGEETYCWILLTDLAATIFGGLDYIEDEKIGA